MTNETYEQRREREQRDEQLQRRALLTLAAGVARELGDNWVMHEKHHNDLDRVPSPLVRRVSDGAEFYLGLDWRDKSRVTVGANWPRNAQGTEQRPYFSQYSEFGASSPAITLSLSKSPAQAAKDIKRRFLSAFLPLWEKQAAVVAGRNAYADRRTALATQIAGLVGGEVRSKDGENATVRVPYRDGHGIADVEFGGDENEITVKLRCSLTDLAEIVKQFPSFVEGK